MPSFLYSSTDQSIKSDWGNIMIRIIYLVLFILGGAIYGSAAADSIFSKNENGLQVRLTVVGGKIQIRNIQETDIEFLLNIYDIHKNPHYSDKRGRNTEQISGMLVTSLDHFKNGRPRGWFIGVEVSTGKPLIGIRFGGGDRSGAADIDAVTTEPNHLQLLCLTTYN